MPSSSRMRLIVSSDDDTRTDRKLALIARCNTGQSMTLWKKEFSPFECRIELRQRRFGIPISHETSPYRTRNADPPVDTHYESESSE